MSLTIQKITESVVATFKNYEKTGTTPWNYKIAAQDLSYQVGSLNKLLMQLHGDRWADKQSREDIMAKISDELSDILTDTAFIAHDLGIDLDQAFESMLQSDQEKVSKRSAS